MQFFGSAFISFMAVAYVPAYLEDRATFIKERANGLYGAMAFTFANFLIGLPYLCLFPSPYPLKLCYQDTCHLHISRQSSSPFSSPS